LRHESAARVVEQGPPQNFLRHPRGNNPAHPGGDSSLDNAEGGRLWSLCASFSGAAARMLFVIGVFHSWPFLHASCSWKLLDEMALNPPNRSGDEAALRRPNTNSTGPLPTVCVPG